MYVIMSNYFQSSLINDPAVTIFILCTLAFFQPSSCVLNNDDKRELWNTVIKDLDSIAPCPKFAVTLYTADFKDLSDCNLSVVKCFHLEMKVILYESKFENDTLFKEVDKVIDNVAYILENEKQDTKTSTWQHCETFAEKNCIEFIENFKTFARKCYRDLETE